MALLYKDGFRQIIKERNSIHEPVKATYTVFEKEGKVFFQIDTYGNSGRKMPEKVSQSLQLDKQIAESLIEELKKAFH